jgi:hypothetical protein
MPLASPLSNGGRPDRDISAVSGAGRAHPGEFDVSAPPPHIPRANERTVLQKLTFSRGLTLSQLYPAGRILIASMVAKGWIERQPDGKTYCRTTKGEEAMKITLKIR